MQCNIGELDKKIRLTVGFIIIAAGFQFGSMWGAIGLFQFCPHYWVIVLLMRSLVQLRAKKIVAVVQSRFFKNISLFSSYKSRSR